MGDQQMKVGIWFYGVGTALTGILNIAWGTFDAAHQPIQALGKNLPGQHVLAYIAGVWLLAAGLAILSQRTVKIGAAAATLAYLMFAALWLVRCYAAIHVLGWRIEHHRRQLVRARTTVNAGRSGGNGGRPQRLTKFPVANESTDRRTLAPRIPSDHLRHPSPHRHSHLRDHRPALDGLWIFLGGAHRNRLLPRRMCHLLRKDGRPRRQASCADAVAL